VNVKLPDHRLIHPCGPFYQGIPAAHAMSALSASKKGKINDRAKFCLPMYKTTLAQSVIFECFGIRFMSVRSLFAAAATARLLFSRAGLNPNPQ